MPSHHCPDSCEVVLALTALISEISTEAQGEAKRAVAANL
jgi:hypothetical protein